MTLLNIVNFEKSQNEIQFVEFPKKQSNKITVVEVYYHCKPNYVLSSRGVITFEDITLYAVIPKIFNKIVLLKPKTFLFKIRFRQAV